MDPYMKHILSKFAITVFVLGSDTLCRHNFEHNTMDGASSIMPAKILKSNEKP